MIAFLSAAFKLLGLASWAEKLWGDHEKIEQGKMEQRYEDATKENSVLEKQLDIAARPTDSPDGILERMSNDNL